MYVKTVVFFVATLLTFATCATQSPTIVRYELAEEQPAGTIVGHLMEADVELAALGELPNSRISFGFTENPGAMWDAFEIDGESGELRSSRSIDRELLCPFRQSCRVELNIMVQPLFRLFNVVVSIIDINDNVPTFPQPSVHVSLAESTTLDALIQLPAAEDLDSAKYGIKSYTLVPPQSHFRLELTSGSEGISDVALALTKSLDRETRSGYAFRVRASDGRTTSELRVNVSVADSNDNNPRFDRPHYDITINENLPPQTVVLTVRAHDADSDANGAIVYAFSTHTELAHGEMFGIDALTGDLYLKFAPDYESERLYQLFVSAHDRGPNSLPAHARVTVRINDINDHKPVVTVNVLAESGRPEVVEHAPVGTFVAHLSVTDPDQESSGDVSCYIRSTEFTLEQLYANRSEYTLKTAAVFDREFQSTKRLDLTCSDNGIEPLTTHEVIEVAITDVNDHDPIFFQKSYSARIREGSVSGVFLLQANASDADAGANAAIKYQIREVMSVAVSDEASALVINPISGVVRTNQVFDYELEQQRLFDIVAVDQGTPARSVTATLTLSIQDTNDSPPSFSSGGDYVFQVFENQPAGTEVGVVAAIDRDSPPFNVVTFSVQPSDGADFFRVDSKSGRITTSRRLDRETTPAFALRVFAHNDGYPGMTGEAAVLVRVADQNDNAPVIRFPSKQNNTFNVASENGSVGPRVIGRIVATDSDEGAGAELFYSLTDTVNDTFSVNPTTGDLLLNGAVSSAKNQAFVLVIQVSDRGIPRRAVSAIFRVVVNYDVAPSLGGTFLDADVTALVIGVGICLVLLMLVVLAVVCTKFRVAKHHHVGDTKSSLNARPGMVAAAAAATTTSSLACDRDLYEKAKKEVTFVDKDIHDWRGTNSLIEDPRAHSSAISRLRPSFERNGDILLNGNVPSRCNANAPTTTTAATAHNVALSEAEMEMHEMLKIITPEQDAETGSNTDSGKGGSEEGEHNTRYSPGLEQSGADVSERKPPHPLPSALRRPSLESRFYSSVTAPAAENSCLPPRKRLSFKEQPELLRSAPLPPSGYSRRPIESIPEHDVGDLSASPGGGGNGEYYSAPDYAGVHADRSFGMSKFLRRVHEEEDASSDTTTSGTYQLHSGDTATSGIYQLHSGDAATSGTYQLHSGDAASSGTYQLHSGVYPDDHIVV